MAFAHAPSTGGKSRAAGESFVWFFGAAELCLAITLNVKLAGIVFLLGFVAHFIAIPLVRKHARKEQAAGPGTADGG